MEQNEFERIMLSWINEEISIKQCIKDVIVTFFFSLPLLIWKWNNFVWLFLGILPIVLFLVTVIKLLENGKIRGIQCGLYHGMNAVFLSLIFNISATALLLYMFEGYWKAFATIIWILCYILMAVCYVHMFRRSMEKKQMKAKRTVGGAIGGVCGLLGYSFARTFIREVSNDTAVKILCICCLILSLLCLLGVGNIVKFYYMKNEPNILERREEVKWQKESIKQN